MTEHSVQTVRMQDNLSGGAGELRSLAGVWRGLLWAEWFAHSQLLLVFLGVWLAAVWTLPLFANPGWILVLGAIYALLAGPIYGGGDILEGCEEFSFALPPTRAERYFSRVAVGLGTVLFLCLMNAVTLGLDLPQILAGLYVKTGALKAAPLIKPALLYTFVLVLPVAVFTFAFAISAVTHSRVLILLSWFWGGLAALALLQAGFWYEELVWENLTGYFASPLLLACSAGALVYGYFVFCRKEVGKASMPLALPGYWWLWTLLFAVGLGLAVALLNSLSTHFPSLFEAR